MRQKNRKRIEFLLNQNFNYLNSLDSNELGNCLDWIKELKREFLSNYHGNLCVITQRKEKFYDKLDKHYQGNGERKEELEKSFLKVLDLESQIITEKKDSKIKPLERLEKNLLKIKVERKKEKLMINIEKT